MSQISYALLLTSVAGAATLLGGAAFMIFRKFEQRRMSLFMGLAGGALVYVSLVDLLPLSVREVGFVRANLAFFGGMAAIALIDFLLPHTYLQEKVSGRRADGAEMSEGHRRLLSVGLLAAVGIAIHNFPEGMAVFWSAVGDRRLGLAMAVAIAAHNIPEGFAVAVPIYAATGSRLKALWMTFLAGAAEPIGAVLGFLVFGQLVSDSAMGYVYGAIAGIMIFISYDELLPACYARRKGHTAIVGIILGMAVMAFSLNWLR